MKEILGQMDEERRQALEKELIKLENQLKDAGVDPEQSPKVKELRAQLQRTTDQAALEEEVYSHLYTFFSRYYDEGDFISKRRYKENVYAIPYNGEEVKLYWANYDQYYIKTSEYFRNYAFRLRSGKRVRFEVVQAEADRDNIKTTNSKKRRFVLHEADPIAEEAGELVIRFEYRPDDRKQEEINKAIAEFILLETDGFEDWKKELKEPRPTPKNKDRTLLEKHLAAFTARNTFDYFIHKDLGGFLRRELDFYIKNEVVHLDDIENESAPRVEQYLAKVKAIRRIGHKIIDFLAQLENFQKKLWLKKKFIWETQYCITLDRIFAIEDEEKRNWLIERILENQDQIEEWKKLYHVHEIKGDLVRPGWSEPPTIEFLKAHPHLVIDTRHFDEEFKLKLISSFDNLDEELDGLLVHGENFQALNLLLERYRGQVKCIYIDPPYNSKTTEILYKNDYKHSSWLTLIDNRLALSRIFATEDGSHIIAIDENEQELLGRLLSLHFPEDHFEKICVSIIHNKKGIQGKYFSYNHDFAYFCIPHKLPKIHGKPIPKEEWEYVNLRKWGRESERETARNCFYPIYVNIKNKNIVGFGDVCDENFHPGKANIYINDQIVAIYPVDQQGIERKWRYSRDSIEKIKHLLKVHITREGEIQILKANTEKQFKTVWDDPKYIAGDYGTRILTELGLKFDENLYPKSIYTVSDAIYAVSNHSDLILDYFAGSGTTAHAVINLNREDGGKRKYILVEVADYFDTVLLPRIKKIIYSRDWKDGKPKPDKDGNLNGISHFLKYIRLESYEDTLNNLELKRTEIQQKLLYENREFREDYILRYMLEFETRESLLNVERFEDPFNYEMEIATTTVGDTRRVKVDMVETFNYLIGLRVKTVDHIRGVRVITGENPQGEKVLILWRNTKEMDAEKLNEWFRKQGYNTRDQEFDIIYVNGDNFLENLRREDHTWKVRLIEEEFLKRMFEVRDV
ncbi:site-specific DNA-methyltransferase [Thermosulfurimonas dismutans]|uniref:site-specific DNA-methyltransferase n=1 Tax=Thermosulfurimonas dismutans TaxID=999894 RepID=UPI001ABFC6E2|nr:site-specific DNA-methyltransferase [Thermosulfurimonas dismutans]